MSKQDENTSPLTVLPGVCRQCGGELSFGHECGQIEKWCGDEAGELPALDPVHEDRQRDSQNAALMVLTRTPAIRAFLAQNDPKALEQAERALGITPCTTDECVKLHNAVRDGANICVELAQTKLWPASTTPKRRGATKRLIVALGELQAANAELFAALADVEDAV